MSLRNLFMIATTAIFTTVSAHAAVLDANHSTTDDPNNNTGLGIVNTSLAQTFTVIGNGILDSISFSILNLSGTTDDVGFDVRGVDIGGNPNPLASSSLFSTSIANADIGSFGPQPYAWSVITVDVSSANIAVSTGDVLSFVLSSSIGEEFGVQTDYLDAYGGGARFSQNGDGTAFSSLATADLTFSTTITPAAIPLPASLPLLAIGFGALGWMRSRRRQAA